MKEGWLRVQFQLARPEALEALTNLGHQFSPGGVEFVTGEAGPAMVLYVRDGPGATDRLEKLQQRIRALEPIFGRPVLASTTVQAVAETDWVQAWQANYGPLPIGEKIVIVPTWLRDTYQDEAQRLPLYMDPGMAFGTGEHTTTRQALTMLEEVLAQPRQRVLDVGAGSGILAMAAARLGTPSVLALDIDPTAVGVARDNLAANGLSAQVRVEEADIAHTDAAVLARWWPGSPGKHSPSAAPDARADVVVSNILLDVLVARAAPLAALVRPGGSLILAGVLGREEAQLQAAFTAQGLLPVRSRRDGQWLVSLFQAPAGTG